MARETVVIPEQKRKIENIKKKFNNQEMSDTTATKIASLEVTNKLLKAATITAGVITVIDLFVPDPVLGLDEAALASITGLLKYSSTIVENKIEALSNSDDASIKIDEVTKLTEQLTKTATDVKRSKSQKR